MNNNLPYLINLPSFIYRGIDVSSFSILNKFLFILKGKFLSFVINRLNGKIFCSFINFFYKDSNLSYSNNLYKKKLKDIDIYFPNKRVLRLVNHPELSLNNIFKSYCLDFINIENDDLVIDCGANVGELNIAIKQKGIIVNYKAFEPDKSTFDCLALNNYDINKNELFNLGLSNLNGYSTFYLDNEGGNSSLVDFGSTQKIEVETKTLDSFEFEKVKILKIDAEGFEPEVLEGSKKTLQSTEYVTIDFGAERGKDQNTTIIEVNDYMYENNFKLVKFSDFRFIGLYKNNKK